MSAHHGPEPHPGPREVRHEQTQVDKAAAREEKARWKRIHEQARARMIVRDKQRW